MKKDRAGRSLFGHLRIVVLNGRARLVPSRSLLLRLGTAVTSGGFGLAGWWLRRDSMDCGRPNGRASTFLQYYPYTYLFSRVQYTDVKLIICYWQRAALT